MRSIACSFLGDSHTAGTIACPVTPIRLLAVFAISWRANRSFGPRKRNFWMSIGLILVILLVIFLLGGFSGRFGGYGYGYGHRGIGVILTVVVVLLLIGRISV